jgi:hypothetical protein
VFVLKITAGVVMYLLYTYYYTDRSTADIFKYFDDSKVMHDALFKNPVDFFRMIFSIGNDTPHFTEEYYKHMHNWFRIYESNIYNDSHTIIRLNALLRIFSFGYYNVHTVFMCFLSLIGLVGLFRFFDQQVCGRRKELFFAFFLIPSVVFWGSGVLKEGILFFGLGMMLWHTYLLIQKKRIIFSMLAIIMSFVLLLFTKFYVLTLQIPLMIAYVWCELTARHQCLLKFGVTLTIFAAIMLNMHYLVPEYDFVAILVQKQNDFLNLAHSVNSGSMISMEPLTASPWSLLKNSPLALYSTLFRPWFFEGGSPFIILAGIENLLIIVIFFVALIFRRTRIQNLSLFLLCLCFAFGIIVLTGLTTPVMGAMVRYKVPALPFLVMVFIMLTDKTKLNKIFPKLARILD